MPRQAKPWRRKETGAWYAWVKGVQTWLAAASETRETAQRAFYRLSLSEKRPKAHHAFASLADAFLGHSAKVHPSETYDQYRYKLQSAVRCFGKVKAMELKTSHVEQWLASQSWGTATRRNAITAVKVVLNFAVSEGVIDKNPLASLKRPKMPRRKRTLLPSERTAILNSITDQRFLDLLTAMAETGARPGELWKLEARHIDWEAGVAVLKKGKTTTTTGEPRVIVLTGKMLEVCKRLAKEHPSGVLFRNSKGDPWNRNSVRCRFRRLREKLNLSGITAYTYRHSFATDGLEKGATLAGIAALMGHSDLKMVSEHYNHLAERVGHLREQAELATATQA
jgi:integrase